MYVVFPRQYSSLKPTVVCNKISVIPVNGVERIIDFIVRKPCSRSVFNFDANAKNKEVIVKHIFGGCQFLQRQGFVVPCLEVDRYVLHSVSIQGVALQ